MHVAIYLETLTTSTTVEEGSTTAGTTTAAGDGATAAQSMVVRDYQALAIVLPIALLTIIINAVLTGVGVYVCIFASRKNKDSKQGESRGYENLEMSPNSLERSNLGPEYINSEG